MLLYFKPGKLLHLLNNELCGLVFKATFMVKTELCVCAFARDFYRTNLHRVNV